MAKDPSLVSPDALPYVHLPGGHQESWADAFCNLMRDAYRWIRRRRRARSQAFHAAHLQRWLSLHLPGRCHAAQPRCRWRLAAGTVCSSQRISFLASRSRNTGDFAKEGDVTEMKLGVFTPLLSKLPLEDVLAKLKLSISHRRAGNRQLSRQRPLRSGHAGGRCRTRPLQEHARRARLQASAHLSCHGNPLHPDPVQAKQYQDVNRKTILLAEKLGVTEIVDFSGCPGDSPDAKLPTGSPAPGRLSISMSSPGNGTKSLRPSGSSAPNSPPITASASPSRCIPASSSTALKRCSACAISLVPPSAATTIPATCSGRASIPSLPSASSGRRHLPRSCQGYADVPANLPRTGVLDTKPYTDERNRGWIFRTCGYGHGAEWWKEFVSTLRMYGYDNVLSIEHEDSLLSPEEGLTKAAAVLERNSSQRKARRSLVGLQHQYV
jgi:sugar phosphate isomerase/epimerase